MIKTPTPRPVYDLTCPGEGTPIAGWGEVTPSASWLLNCGLCTANQEQQYTITGSCSSLGVSGVCVDTSEGCTCPMSIPNPILFGTPTPNGTPAAGTPTPGVDMRDFYLGDPIYAEYTAPAASGGDAVFYTFHPADFLGSVNLVGWVGVDLDCVGQYDACREGQAGWITGSGWNYASNFNGSHPEPQCYAQNYVDGTTANEICLQVAGVGNYNGTGSSVWSMGELIANGVTTVEMVLHGGSYSWDYPAPYQGYIRLIYYGVPPTPEPEIGYCQEVEPESEGTSWEDVGTLPVPMIGPGQCLVIDAFSWDIGWLNSISQWSGMSVPPVLDFPGVQLCVRPVEFGVLNILNIAVNLDTMAMYMSVVAALFMLWRS